MEQLRLSASLSPRFKNDCIYFKWWMVNVAAKRYWVWIIIDESSRMQNIWLKQGMNDEKAKDEWKEWVQQLANQEIKDGKWSGKDGNYAWVGCQMTCSRLISISLRLRFIFRIVNAHLCRFLWASPSHLHFDSSFGVEVHLSCIGPILSPRERQVFPV